MKALLLQGDDSGFDPIAIGVDEGEIVSCPECGSDFEIVTVSPIELKPVEEEIDDDDEVEEAEDGDYS